jgi:hypothetical protein
MHTEVTLYINDIKIPIAPVAFEYGVSSGEMTQIATISPKINPAGSTGNMTYVYRDLGEKYIDLTFNIRTSDKSWIDTYGSNMGTDTDSIINPQNNGEITNPQEFINWMIYAHGSGEPLKITIEKLTQYAEGKDFTHMLTGTYKVSHTSISSSADRLYHYATFSLGLARYMPPVMKKVKMVCLGGDPTDISVLSNVVESYDPVQTTGRLRVSSTSEASDEGHLERTELELVPMQSEVINNENNQNYFKQLAVTTVANAMCTARFDSERLLRDVFIEHPMKIYNRQDPLAPLKGLGYGFLRVVKREAKYILNTGRKDLIKAADAIAPILGMGVEMGFNIVEGLVSKIPLPSFLSEGPDASAETPLLGDGGIVISYDTDLGFDPKLHATGFDPDTISPVYRILEPGIYKRE